MKKIVETTLVFTARYLVDGDLSMDEILEQVGDFDWFNSQCEQEKIVRVDTVEDAEAIQIVRTASGYVSSWSDEFVEQGFCNPKSRRIGGEDPDGASSG